MHIHQLETPVVIVDLTKVEANINRLQSYLDEHGVANRPHIKTHKIPEIAHMQLKAGAVGIACQKISEAEVMAQAGIPDIIPAEACYLGWQESLRLLARLVEPEIPDGA